MTREAETKSLAGISPLRCVVVLVLAFSSLVASESTQPDVPSAAAECTLAKQALDRNEPEQAIACASRAALLAPSDPECQHLLGVAYANASRQANVVRRLWLARKSAAAFRRAIALAPNNADFHQSLFDYYRRTPAVIGGGFEKALNEAAAVKRFDSMRGALDYAKLYLDHKDYDLARAQLEPVLQKSPDDVTALYQTGRIASISGQYLDHGLASLRLCLALPPSPEEGAPTAAELNWRIGIILEKKGQKDAARVAYIKSLAANPKFAPAFAALKKLNA